MKQKILLLILFGQTLTMLQAQTMVVQPQTGNTTDYIVSGIKKLTFSSGNLVVSNTEGNVGIFTLSTTRNLSFTFSNLNTATKLIEKNSCYVIVNPITDVLTVFNPKATSVITDLAIIAIDGRIVKTQLQINKNEVQVGVSDVPSGVYFCRITTNHSTQTIKFLKQ